MTKEDIKQAIRSMTVLELSELVKELEEEFGVTAAAPIAMAAMPAGGEGGKPAEEKTEFRVTLKAIGDNKIPVIKVIREITGLGLAEAKALVDGAPSTVKEAVSNDDAQAMKQKLEAVGATVAID